MLRIGDNIDSWCGNCKMILAHTIEAMVGERPARVHCNTCGSQHNYKHSQPGESQPRKIRSNRYQTLLASNERKPAKRYSPKGSYAPGDIVEHPKFGVGIAIAVKETTKVQVLFVDGEKVLVHEGNPQQLPS